MDNIASEVSAAKEQIRELQISLVSKQSQQQWNISLPSPEVARAFAESAVLQPEKPYPPLEVEKDMEQGVVEMEDDIEQGIIEIEDAIKKREMRLYFLWSADEAISLANWPLRMYYVYEVVRLEGRRVKAEEILGKSLTDIIEQITKFSADQWTDSPDIRDTFLGHLECIDSLIELRQAVSKGEAEPPSIEEGKEILSKVSVATTYMSGMNASALYTLGDFINLHKAIAKEVKDGTVANIPNVMADFIKQFKTSVKESENGN